MNDDDETRIERLSQTVRKLAAALLAAADAAEERS